MKRHDYPLAVYIAFVAAALLISYGIYGADWIAEWLKIFLIAVIVKLLC